MKNLFILLLILSCGKIGMKPIGNKANDKVKTRQSVNYSLYDTNIDIMVAFLWPPEIETEKQKKLVREIIITSRDLRSGKDEYFARKVELQKEFKAYSCQCALNDLCDEGEVPGPKEKCIEIENLGYENDTKLIAILEMVEKVKVDVAECGGEWLETQSDLPEVDLSVFDAASGFISFSALGSDENGPHAYVIENLKPRDLDLYTELKFSVPRVSGGILRFDLGMKAKPYSLTIQGELFFTKYGKQRRGIVYWEQPAIF